MNRRRLAIAIVLLGLLAASAVTWSSCRGGAGTSRSATTGAATSGGDATGAAGKRIDVGTVARGSIEGTVADPAGAAVAGARVCGYVYSEDLPDDLTRDPICVTSGADGRYRLEQLLPARYELHAHAARFSPGRYSIETADGRDDPALRLGAGDDRRGIDITLRPGGVEVTGVVKDISGGTIAGAWVYLRSGRRWEQGESVATVQSEADGTFRAWAAPGRMHATAEADGYASGDQEAIAPGQTIELLLTPESVLAGRVIETPGGAPVAGARVEVGGWNDDDGTGWASALTDVDGRFRLTQLAPGRYKPTASAPGRRGQSAQSVLLGLGQTVEGIVIEVHPAATVTGRVVLDDGTSPCPEGWVSLRDELQQAGGYATIEGDDGVVELDPLFAGTYQVELQCTGRRAEKAYPAVVVVAGANPPEQVWKVSAGARLRGLVLGHDGQPVGDIPVQASPAVSDDPWGSWRSATTEADGSFEMTGLRGGMYKVTATPTSEPGNPEPVEVEVPDTGEASVEIRLPQGGAVAGMVRDEDGVAVPRVTVQARTSSWRWGDSNSTQTLDDGSFLLPGLTPGDHRVLASRDSWGMSALRAPGKTDDDLDGEKVNVVAGQTARVALVVESQSGVIRGQVVDGDGAAITDAFVDAERESDSAAASEGGAQRAMRWSWQRRPSLTDTDGGFAIERLSKGTYTVRAYRKGGGEALVERVAIGATVTVTIRAPGSIAGTVARPGGGVPDRMTVTVRDNKTGLRRSEEFFRTDGRFVMRDLPGAEYEIAVRSGDGAGTATAVLGDGQQLTGVAITLAGRAGVTGRLVTADDGKPLAGYLIGVMPAGAMDGMSFGPGVSPPTSDADGRFEVPNAPAGRVQVVANTLDMEDTPYVFVRKFVTLEAGKTLDLGDLKVPRMRARMGDQPGDLGFELKQSRSDADPETEKLIVAIVRADSAAARAGLKVGDEIVSVDGQDVRGDSFLYWSLTHVPPGTALTLGLADGRSLAITAGPPRT